MDIFGIVIGSVLALSLLATLAVAALKRKKELDYIEAEYIKALHDITRTGGRPDEVLLEQTRYLGESFYEYAIPMEPTAHYILIETGIAKTVEQRRALAQKRRLDQIESDIKAAIGGDVSVGEKYPDEPQTDSYEQAS